MAPSRGKGKTRANVARNGTSTPTRRTQRSAGKDQGGVPEVYRDLLAEAEVTGSASEASDRPLKRRKVATSASMPRSNSFKNLIDEQRGTNGNARGLQTVEDSSASDDEDESDFGFEDVDLEQPALSSPGPAEDDDEDIADVSISVDPTTVPKLVTSSKRKPVSAAEKAFRLLVHKAHVLCLLGHCFYVNSWCNNIVVQRLLKPILSTKTLSYLKTRSDDSQFQRNRSFMDGLLQASEAFRGQFKINASGMRKARWASDDPEDNGVSQIETHVTDRAEFIDAARNMEGSQDTGNQLFCALLRAAGVEARLVCSLQPLPFASAPTKSSTPQKFLKPTVYATTSGTRSPAPDSNTSDSAVENSSSIGKVPSARRRLGQPTFAAEPAPATTPRKKKSIRKLTYPIFWVEAFNHAHQKWIPLDPLVTQTLNKPSKLEPPSSYDLNQLTYAIAFESNSVARDVTRRYAKSFNAKTRRHRVESTDNGTIWMKKTLRLFRRRGPTLDRDQVEDAELAQREAREGLPSNVQDFKDHPYYALERHLKRHEVLHPRREVGKVNAGTAARPRMEAVFRRQDVCVCRSADKWFRVGREIIEGEQGVKRVPARRARTNTAESEDGEDGEKAMMALYAPFQTRLYVPAPVVRGKVPRNTYGNLDIYVPSMVPAGGSHIRHPLAKDAARFLKIDYADAVTGFQFKGRQGTAITEGVVVASEYAEAVKAVVEGLTDEMVEEESRGRSKVALGMWKRFLTGLRITHRVSGYADPTATQNIQDGIQEEDFGDARGGFLPGEAADEHEALPTAGRFSLVDLGANAKVSKRSRKKNVSDQSEEEAEFSEEESAVNEQDMQEASRRSTRTKRNVVEDESEDESMPDHVSPMLQPDDGDDGGGGFLPDDNDEVDDAGGDVPETGTTEDEGGGGFVAEDSDIDRDAGGGFLYDESEMFEDSGGFVQEDAEMADDENEAVEDFVVDKYRADAHFLINGQQEAPDHKMSGALQVGGSIDDSTLPRTHSPSDLEPDDELDMNEDCVDSTGQGYQSNEDSTNVCAQESPRDDVTITKIGSGLDASFVSPAGAGVHENAEEKDQSDQGSMISHDPEDEDAEPDWLESD